MMRKLDSSAQKAAISAFFNCDHIENAGARASIQRLAHVIEFGSMAELRQVGAAGAVKRGASTYYVHDTEEESYSHMWRDASDASCTRPSTRATAADCTKWR